MKATVVAFDLGKCRGRVAYLKVTWYFPSRGDTFDKRWWINACTAAYSPEVRYSKCGAVVLRNPPGRATEIQAFAMSCAAARSLVAATPSARYAEHFERRFRMGRLYCGTEGPLLGEAIFECGYGNQDVLWNVAA